MASILLVVKHAQQDAEAAQKMRRIALETSTTPADGETYKVTAAGDNRKLRGIPALSRGVAGAISGTVPHIEVCRDA